MRRTRPRLDGIPGVGRGRSRQGPLLAFIPDPYAMQLRTLTALTFLLSGTAFGQQALDVQSLQLSPRADGGLSASVFLGSEDVQLDLAPTSFYTARDAQSLAPGALETYSGTVAGEPTSRVAATMRDGQLRVLLWRAGSDHPWWVLPANQLDPRMPDGLHSALPDAQVPRGDEPWTCRGADSPTNAAGAVSRPSGTSQSSSSGAVVAEIVAEADFEYVQDAGSQQAAEDRMVETIFFTSAIYEFSLGVRFEIVDLVSYPDANDPYTADGSGSQILNEFGFEMISRYQVDEFDAAQLFSGRDLGGVGGTAYCRRICQSFPNHRALSVVGAFSALATRVGVTAHELGHNFGARHCDGAPNGGSCGSSVEDDCGFMGYNSLTRMGSFTAAEIRAYLAQYNACLDPDPTGVPLPTLDPLATSTLEALPTSDLQGELLVLTGLDLDSVHMVDTTQDLLSLEKIDAIDPTAVTFRLPYPEGLGTQDLRVANASGWSNSLPLTIVATDPPRALVEADPNGLFGLSALAGGIPGAGYQVLYSDQGTTTSVGGFDVLAAPLFTDAGILDAAGLAPSDWFPPSTGTTYHVQLLSRDGSGAFYATAVQALAY